MSASRSSARKVNRKGVFNGCKIFLCGKLGSRPQGQFIKLINDNGGEVSDNIKLIEDHGSKVSCETKKGPAYYLVCSPNSWAKETTKVKAARDKIPCVRIDWIIDSAEQAPFQLKDVTPYLWGEEDRNRQKVVTKRKKQRVSNVPQGGRVCDGCMGVRKVVSLALAGLID